MEAGGVSKFENIWRPFAAWEKNCQRCFTRPSNEVWRSLHGETADNATRPGKNAVPIHDFTRVRSGCLLFVRWATSKWCGCALRRLKTNLFFWRNLFEHFRNSQWLSGRHSTVRREIEFGIRWSQLVAGRKSGRLGSAYVSFKRRAPTGDSHGVNHAVSQVLILNFWITSASTQNRFWVQDCRSLEL